MGMKKIVTASLAVLVALTTTVSVAPASASTKSLVVFDSYFDSRVGNTPIECLPGALCGLVGKPKASLTAEVNHGVAMVDAAKTAFPGVPVIALQASSATGAANVGHLVLALEWAISNRHRIAAISVSRKMNGTTHASTGCSAASTNTAQFGGVSKADEKVRSLVAELNSYGIPVFASTGNVRKSKLVDYPACIQDTNSVSVGKNNSLGAIVSNYTFNDATDYFVSLGNGKPNLNGTVFKSLPNTTSLATVLAAAKYVATSNLDKMVVIG